MGVIRASARLLLPGYIEAGLSGNMIIKTLRQAGLSYRRTDLLKDIRIMKGIAISATRIKNVRKDRIPSSQVFARGPTPHNAEYAYQVRLSSFDPYTGKAADTWVTMLDDKRRSIQEMEDKAVLIFGKESEDQVYNVSDVVNVQSATVHSAIIRDI